MVVRRLWCVAIVAIVAIGCGKSTSQPTRTETQSVDAAAVPADPWTGPRYSKLARKIAADCEAGDIPRLGRDDFAAVIDVRNLEAADRSGAPARERLPSLLELNDGQRELMWAYFNCGDHIEMIAMVMTCVESMTRMLSLTEEFLAGFSPGDPTYQTRVAGRDRAINGLAEMIGGLVVTLRDPAFDVRGLEGIAARLGASFGGAWRVLPDDATSLHRRILQAAASEATEPSRKVVLELVVENAAR